MEKLLEYYNEIQFEAAKDAYKATCHYLTVDGEGNPSPHGSGVFIEIDTCKFLITAAHVVDGKENDIYVGIGPNNLLKLGGELTRNFTGNRNHDKVDISILKLNDETIKKLEKNYAFISKEELGINHQVKTLPMYTSVGFQPLNQNLTGIKMRLKVNPLSIIQCLPINRSINSLIVKNSPI